MFTRCNYLLHYLQRFSVCFILIYFLSTAAAAATTLPPRGGHLSCIKFNHTKAAEWTAEKKMRRHSPPTLTWAPPCRWPEPERWSPSCPPGRCRAGCRSSRTLWTPWRCGPCGRRSWFGTPSMTGLQMMGWSTWWLWRNEDKPILSLLHDLLYRGVIGA